MSNLLIFIAFFFFINDVGVVIVELWSVDILRVDDFSYKK